MIIFLSELQKEHLSLLHQHSTQVLVDFCKLVIDYLNNGYNNKKYCIAAEKLDVSVTVVQNLVHALLYLMVEGCKHRLTEGDFKSSLAIAGFSDDHQEVLIKLYSTKNSELCNALSILNRKDPSYQDLKWRFEVQVASKGCDEEIKPMIAMDFVITTPKNPQEGPGKEGQRNKEQPSSICINSSIQDAKTASQCQNVINHVLLQCDLPNLVHLTNKLEQALNESKSQHVRKVQRAL